MALKLVSINIELNKHVDAVASFLKEERPDVVCLLEVLESDMPRFREALGCDGRFEPMAFPRLPHHLAWGLGAAPFGIAIFSRFEAVFDVLYYHGTRDVVPAITTAPFSANRMLLYASLATGGRRFHIGTTHLTWTPDGEADEQQRKDAAALLAALANLPDIVFCGDFNAPRGKEIWNEIAARYTDNIPREYDSSLDPQLHRVRDVKKFVVDGLFSTPEYVCTDTKLVCGISDHCAVVSMVERTG